MTENTKPMLFIVGMSEEGLFVDLIFKSDFKSWYEGLTIDIKTECWPRFVSSTPFEDNEYMIIEGRVIVPQPVQVVTSYVLPD